MNICPWKLIDDFEGWVNFNRFLTWIEHEVQLGHAKELPVRNTYLGFTLLDEKWFQHIPSGEIWRLVWPDPPFKGLFEKIEELD